MGILKKGKDFTPTEQVTSTKLDELVDNASFTDSNEDKVAYTGTSGTCLNGGGLEVTGLGQLQIANSGVGTNELTDTSVTTAKINDSAVTTGKINDSAVTTAKIADDAVTGAKIESDVGLTGAPTAPTPSSSSNSTRIATTAYVTSGINNALTGVGGLFGTIDQTANGVTRIFSKQSDGDYDSVTPSGNVTMTQAGVFSIANGAVTSAKIGGSAVTSAKIGGSAVTSAKIAGGAVTGAKISSSAALPNGVTATTQTANDNSTKVATTAYVDTAAANPDRTYYSTSLGTSSGTIQQNTTNRPLLINFGLKSNDEIALLALDISQNSDMSSETRVSMFQMKTDGPNPSRATVSGVVPNDWYWKVTYTGTSSASELFHVGFNL